MSSTDLSIVTELKTLNNHFSKRTVHDGQQKAHLKTKIQSKIDSESSSDISDSFFEDLEVIYPTEKRVKTKLALVKEAKAMKDMKSVFEKWGKDTKNVINKSKTYDLESSSDEDLEEIKRRKIARKKAQEKKKVYERTDKSIRDFSTARISLPLYGRNQFIPSGRPVKQKDDKYSYLAAQVSTKPMKPMKPKTITKKKTKNVKIEQKEEEKTEKPVDDIAKIYYKYASKNTRSPKHASIANLIKIESSDSDEEFVRYQRAKVKKNVKLEKAKSIYLNNSESSSDEFMSSLNTVVRKQKRQPRFVLTKENAGSSSEESSDDSDASGPMEISSNSLYVINKIKAHSKFEDDELKRVLNEISDSTSDSDNNDYEFFDLTKTNQQNQAKQEEKISEVSESSNDETSKRTYSTSISTKDFSSPLRKAKKNSADHTLLNLENESVDASESDEFKLVMPRSNKQKTESTSTSTATKSLHTMKSASSIRKTVSEALAKAEEEEEDFDEDYVAMVKQKLIDDQRAKNFQTFNETGQVELEEETQSEELKSQQYSDFDEEFPSPMISTKATTQKVSSIQGNTMKAKSVNEKQVAKTSPHEQMLSEPVVSPRYSLSSTPKISATNSSLQKSVSNNFETPNTSSRKSGSINITPAKSEAQSMKSTSQSPQFQNEDQEVNGSIIEEEEEDYSSSIKISINNKFLGDAEEEDEEEEAHVNKINEESMSDDNDISIPHPHTPEWDAWIKKQVEEIEKEDDSDKEENADDEILPQSLEGKANSNNGGNSDDEPISKPSISSQPSAMSISDADDSPQVLPKSHMFSDSLEEEEEDI